MKHITTTHLGKIKNIYLKINEINEIYYFTVTADEHVYKN